MIKRRHLLLSGGAMAASYLIGQSCQSTLPSSPVVEGTRPSPSATPSAELSEMTERVTSFLQSLGPEQQRQAVFPYDSAERLNWHYTPRSRQGISFKDMTREQRQAAEGMLQFTLSETGYQKVQDILTLETVLRQQGGSPAIRDPELYFWTVFGNPGAIPWGWRLEGHHLSLNIAAMSEDTLVVTPAFWGANPAEVQGPPHQGLRALAQEQDLAFDLMRSLTAAQQERVILANQSFGNILAGPRPSRLEDAAGLRLGEMDAASRDRAVQLIETYVGNLRGELAARQLQRIRDAGIDAIRFSWAGALDPDQGHYYRLHGPIALIEYDNTRNDANHIHSVWHDLEQGFGVDALRAHYAQVSHG
ncbi:MAG: DUF3500 domain-containing protein [Elainellaceae cyanobacterium]